SLIHADYHWDGVSDFYGSQQDEDILLSADDAALEEMIRGDHLIRYDSFIAPAVLRRYFSDVHFFCKQADDDDEIDNELLTRTGTAQFIHQTTGALTHQQYQSPLIYDLCLDLFNNSDMFYQSDLWPDDEIIDFLTECKPLVQRAHL